MPVTDANTQGGGNTATEDQEDPLASSHEAGLAPGVLEFKPDVEDLPGATIDAHSYEGGNVPLTASEQLSADVGAHHTDQVEKKKQEKEDNTAEDGSQKRPFKKIPGALLHSMSEAEIRSVASDRGYDLGDSHGHHAVRHVFAKLDGDSDLVDQDSEYQSNQERNWPAGISPAKEKVPGQMY